jgi:hypothetical protein
LNKIIPRGQANREELKVGDVFHKNGYRYLVQKIVHGIPYLEEQEEVQFT